MIKFLENIPDIKAESGNINVTPEELDLSSDNTGTDYEFSTAINTYSNLGDGELSSSLDKLPFENFDSNKSENELSDTNQVYNMANIVGANELSSSSSDQLLAGVADQPEIPTDVQIYDETGNTYYRDIENLRSYAVLAKQAICDQRIILSDEVYVTRKVLKNKLVISFAANEEKAKEFLKHKAFIDVTFDAQKFRVNKGWYLQFVKMRDAFLKLFITWKSEINPLKELVFVGYSFGGVFATLAALLVRLPNLPKPNVYTYGSPRIGDIPFAKYANEKVKLIRATNGIDDIPRSPTYRDLLKNHWSNYYSHFGEEYWIEGSKISRCLPVEGELESGVRLF
ncbi:hypothetical protein G9A89_015070 [Geosiphon pyriformis]|nr:hypothetical protein G9A89_015070 [Geosiphon pyriformis]